jgi:hypothetical protein
MPKQNTLPKYSNDPNFVGYPFFYVVEDYKCECHECATESRDEGKTVTPHVNYDDPQLYCFTCSEQIEASNGAHETDDEDEGDGNDDDFVLEGRRLLRDRCFYI